MIYKLIWIAVWSVLGYIMYEQYNNYLIQLATTDKQEELVQEEEEEPKPVMYIILPNSEQQ